MRPMSPTPAPAKAISNLNSSIPGEWKENPTVQNQDGEPSTDDHFTTPDSRSYATSVKSDDSKETLKAEDSHLAPVTSKNPVPNNGTVMEAPAAADSNESEKYYTLNDAIDEKGLTASKGNEREEHSAPVEAPDLKTSSNAPGTQYLSKSEAKGSRAGSELEKEVGLEAGHGSTSSVKKEETELMAETANPDIVDWDGPDDPQNALNWSPAMKSGNIAVMCVITFLTPLASSMLAPGVPEVMQEFKSDNIELASFVVSVFVLGYAFGPILIAPLSEIFGRVPLYHIGNTGFVLFTVACALSKNLSMLIGFRFLEGLFGATPLTIGGGTIADMVKQEKRGGIIAIWALGPLMGPAIGPIAGGFLANSALGWRWIFWVLAIAGGVTTIMGVVCFRETYPTVLLERKANRLRKETGNPKLKSKLASKLAYKDYFKLAIERPARLLVGSPIVLFTSVYVAIIYSYLYLLFTTITEVYESIYHFSPGIVGLTYLGFGIGCFLAVVIFGFASDRILKRMSAKGEMKPEYRLPALIPGSFFAPAGLFIYGWTTYYHVHWIAPIIGTALVGFGLVATSMPIQTYLIDTFTIYAASAVAANIFLRSLLGSVLPLAGRQLYITLGLGWGNSLLAFIALACCPIPVILFRYGEKIRKNKKWNVTL